MKVQCKSCNKFVELENFNKHFDRCNSIIYMQKKIKQLYDKDISYSGLYELDDSEFKKKYFGILNKAYEQTENKTESKLLENVLYGANHNLKGII